MNSQETIQVKFSGSPQDMDYWEKEFQQAQGQVNISSKSQEKDPTALNFGLIETAALVTIITFGFYSAELVTRIFVFFKEAGARKDAKNKVLIVETPLGKAVFTANDELSKEQIKAKLDALVKAHG